MTRLDVALDAIRFSRGYTNGLLEAVPEEDWFRMPQPAVTHVAWQVGHLAWAEYRLVFQRVFAGHSEPPAIAPPEYGELFGKGTQPHPDPGHYPAISEIRTVFETVHAEVLAQVATLPDDVLDEPSQPPHPAFTNRYGALLWVSRHELVHAGQIALLRRLFGADPIR